MLRLRSAWQHDRAITVLHTPLSYIQQAACSCSPLMFLLQDAFVYKGLTAVDKSAHSREQISSQLWTNRLTAVSPFQTKASFRRNIKGKQEQAACLWRASPGYGIAMIGIEQDLQSSRRKNAQICIPKGIIEHATKEAHFLKDEQVMPKEPLSPMTANTCPHSCCHACCHA